MTKQDHNWGCRGKIYRDQSRIFIVAPCWCGRRYDEPLHWLFRLEHGSKLSSWHSSADTSWHNCATETMTRNPANAAAALPGSVLSSTHARKHIDTANFPVNGAWSLFGQAHICSNVVHLLQNMTWEKGISRLPYACAVRPSVGI